MSQGDEIAYQFNHPNHSHENNGSNDHFSLENFPSILCPISFLNVLLFVHTTPKVDMDEHKHKDESNSKNQSTRHDPIEVIRLSTEKASSISQLWLCV